MRQPESDTAALFENDLALLRAIFGEKSGIHKKMTPEERIEWMRRWMPRTYAYLAASRRIAEFAGGLGSGSVGSN